MAEPPFAFDAARSAQNQPAPSGFGHADAVLAGYEVRRVCMIARPGCEEHSAAARRF